jgi:hypothetical protein
MTFAENKYTQSRCLLFYLKDFRIVIYFHSGELVMWGGNFFPEIFPENFPI